MEASVKLENDPSAAAADSKVATAADVEAALKTAKARKRTKTGCLTCRKRRIKCGEELPTCKNCTKSKRICEGYHQRVTFKPNFDFRSVPNGGAHITFQAGTMPGPNIAYAPGGVHPGFDFSQMHPQAYDPYIPYHSVHEPSSITEYHQHLQGLGYAPSGLQDHVQIPSNPYLVSPRHYSADPNAISPQSYEAPQPAASHMQSFAEDTTLPVNGNIDLETWAQQLRNNSQQKFPWPWIKDAPVEQPSSDLPRSPRVHPLMQNSTSDDAAGAPLWTAGSYMPRPELSKPIDDQWPSAKAFQLEAAANMSLQSQAEANNMKRSPDSTKVTPEYIDYEPQAPTVLTPTHMLIEAAIEAYDEDYNDVHSEDEMDMDCQILPVSRHERQQALTSILEKHHITIKELQTRRYDTFLCDGILDHYRVEQAANPLRNPATARVFAHFVSVTGPSLSVFERHLRSSSLLFNGEKIPLSKQGLWTYTMPMAAMHHQGLLHAMLALASLQIARLTGASHTPSLQHYSWALKRIHHCVGHPKKRLKLTTVAASLLLGFYEVMTADHSKWCAHLAGSKQLFIETDFKGMAQQLKKMKKEKAARDNLGRKRREDSQSGQDQLLDQIPDIDERVLSILNGKEVNYDDPGHIMTSESRMPKPLDLSKLEILRDLYWWYCKQDVYQSFVSGNALLLPFDRWADCPPRAPLGRLDSVYGSFDHLILLLARLADFVARDRVRKIRQVKENGGMWRPAPGMRMPGPPPQTPTSATSTNGSQSSFVPPASKPASPDFYGMAPPPRGNVQMPSSYHSLNNNTPPQSTTTYPAAESIDLKPATQEALEEYGRIRAALHTFSTSLGESFQPLTSDYQPTLETPFGSALFYRSYELGVLWAVYNMAVIIAIRSHPHMPPAAHMAAGVAAQETAFFANEIGRIAAGIVPGPVDQPLNPSLGAALCESCLPSFFAAIQYRDPAQRDTTVRRIMSIAKRTGWGTAEVIGTGCETAWVKAAAMGRGPPYTRLFARKESSEDPRINGRWERQDPNAHLDETDDGDRRLVKSKPSSRLTWAIGVMGMEDDFGGTGK